MSEKRRGGLDYTPRAFPGARAPDGPAPDLESQLAKLGLVERAEAKEPRSDARADVSPGVNSGAKKRAALEYTPQAFPGARAPDGPAPGLEERLVQMGLAERTEARAVRPDARHDTSYAPPPAQARREPAAPVPAAASSLPASAPSVHRERFAAPVPQARPAPPPVFSHQPIAEPRERIAVPSPPLAVSAPIQEPTRRAERSAPLEPEPPRRTERVAPPPVAPPQTFTSTPQPVYLVEPPESASIGAGTSVSSLHTQTKVPQFPAVPTEAAPRPLPVVEESANPASTRQSVPAEKAVPKSSMRAAGRIARLKKLPDKEERVRLSVRLVASVDAKLNELAHLRGLDRNTAISVAIVQDWVECFGLHSRQSDR